MVTYDFYENTYLGSAISEKAFPALAARAEEELKVFERIYRVECPGADSRAMAVCAMAEVLWTGSEKKDFEGFLNRMQTHRRRLVKMGVNCAPLR